MLSCNSRFYSLIKCNYDRAYKEMKMSAGLLRTMALFAVAGLLQGLACMRYINKMSDDHTVIIWYFVVLILYTVAAAFFYFKWVNERRKETGECTEKK